MWLWLLGQTSMHDKELGTDILFTCISPPTLFSFFQVTPNFLPFPCLTVSFSGIQTII